jgi:undecaprenyl-diphosphatase
MYSFGSWDTNTLFALNGLAGHSVLADALIVFTATYLPFLLVGAFAWFLYRERRMPLSEKVRAFGLSMIAALIARGLDSPIRFFFPRPRPFLSYHLTQLIPENSPGFPSGHASFFFALSAIVYAYVRRLAAVSFLASVLICLARVAAGVHYPSDILGGAILGTLTGWVCIKIARSSGLYSSLK